MTRCSSKNIALALAALALAVLAAGCGARRQHDTIARQGQMMRVELARTYIEKGALEAAIPLLRRAVAERPNDPQVRTLYGTVLRDLGLYPQAEQQLRFALDRAPNYAPAHAAIAILFDLQRRSREALAHHRRAVALAPRVAAYHNNLGFSLYVAGDLDGAIAHYERALALDPALGVAYNNLGFAYGLRGDVDAARRAFRAVAAEPAALLNLALVFEQRGDDARAAALRERAYAAAPDLRPRVQEVTR